MSNKGRRIAVFCVFLVLSVLWMGVIFGFSSNDAEKSTRQSNTVTRLVLGILNPDFDEMSQEQQDQLISKYDGIIRKLAHFAAYTALGIFTYAAAGSVSWIPDRLYIPMSVSVPISVIFSCTDEFHQTMVDGRAGRISDILIDSSGVVFGTFLCIVGLKLVIYKYRKNRA